MACLRDILTWLFSAGAVGSALLAAPARPRAWDDGTPFYWTELS